MENTRAKTTRNSLILLLTATIWGMAFVSQSKGMDYMHPFTFNGVRSLIGAAGILVYILISRKIAGDKAAKLDWKLNVRAGLLCGIFLTIASTLQQFGIKYTSVGKAGFITTLYIIFVPMFGISVSYTHLQSSHHQHDSRADRGLWTQGFHEHGGLHGTCRRRYHRTPPGGFSCAATGI